MPAAKMTSIEKQVLRVLGEASDPVNLESLIEKLDTEDPGEIKSAALRLITRGEARLNERWQISAQSKAVHA